MGTVDRGPIPILGNNQDRQQLGPAAPPLGSNDAELRHQPAQLVAQHGMLLHQQIAHPDQIIPMSDFAKVKAARPDVAIHVYKAGHGFNCDERASFDAAATKTALERTLKFFKETLA